MKKIFLIIFLIIYPQIALAQTFEIQKNQMLIKCDDTFSIEIPENTFSEKTYIECKKIDEKDKKNIKLSSESIGTIYSVTFTDKDKNEIKFFRNELKIFYQIDEATLAKNINVYVYDGNYNNWIVMSTEKNDKNITAKMFLGGYIGIFVKGADNNSIDIYTTLFFNILVVIFISSSIYLFFAIINKKTI